MVDMLSAAGWFWDNMIGIALPAIVTVLACIMSLKILEASLKTAQKKGISGWSKNKKE